MDWAGHRRVYRETAVTAFDGGFAPTLDGRPVRTPADRPLAVPTRSLAEAIAEEWDAQEKTVRPETMPLAGLAATALDRVGPARSDIVAQVAGYGATDLLCYRAESPDELVRRQAAAWQPLLDWAADAHGAPLAVTVGVLPVEQPVEALAKLRAAVEAADDFRLAALTRATKACGSLVIGLALIQGRLDAEAAFEASFVDDDFQIERWGADDEALARRNRLRADVAAAERFLRLLTD